jgi:hypothetical protein
MNRGLHSAAFRLGRFVRRFTSALFLNFADPLAQFLSPLRHRIPCNTGKLDECGFPFSGLN